MRKTMWKKGLSVAMAAAMLAGPVNVPAVFHNVAIVKADEATGLKDPDRKSTRLNSSHSK